MTVWMRAAAHVLLGDVPLAPGEARRLNPDSPVHQAIVAEVAAGRREAVELVQSEEDPSRPQADPPPDAAVERARAEARSHERRLRADNPMEQPFQRERNRKDTP